MKMRPEEIKRKENVDLIGLIVHNEDGGVCNYSLLAVQQKQLINPHINNLFYYFLRCLHWFSCSLQLSFFFLVFSAHIKYHS